MSEKEKQPQGLSLLDIAPLTEKVAISLDNSLIVTGISAKGAVSLFRRFPEAQKWFAAAGQNIKVAALVNEIPDAIASIIAAGCGSPENPAAEEVAAMLPLETQLDILEAIGRLTFRNGFGPFVKRIAALAAQAESVNYGRAQATKSQPASKPSSPPDTTPKPSGS